MATDDGNQPPLPACPLCTRTDRVNRVADDHAVNTHPDGWREDVWTCTRCDQLFVGRAVRLTPPLPTTTFPRGRRSQ